jgi:hypothetical protein
MPWCSPLGVYHSTDGAASFTRLQLADGAQQAVLANAIRRAPHPTNGQVSYVP